MKKLLAISLCLAMLLCSTAACFAEELPILISPRPSTAAQDAEAAKAIKAAEELYEKGLLSGTGTDENGKPEFSLDKPLTRAEAITAILALQAKTEEARKTEINMPFTDVADWAKPYISYAYNKGITAGLSKTLFGSDELVTANQFLSYTLAALGYKAGSDFEWDKAYVLSDKLGISSGKYTDSSQTFLRADMAMVMRAALNAEAKPGSSSGSNAGSSENTRPPVSKTPVIVLDAAYISDDNADYSLTILFAGEKMEVKSKVIAFTPTAIDSPLMYRTVLNFDGIVKELREFSFENSRIITDFSERTRFDGDILLAAGTRYAMSDKYYVYKLAAGAETKDWKIGSGSDLSISAGDAQKLALYDIDGDLLYDYALVFE